MTREEAKKILEAYIACESKKAHFKCSEYNCDDDCPLLYDMGTVGEYNEAINMAIQALEQEPKWIPVSERLPEEGTYLVATERIVGAPRIDMKSFAKDLNKVDEFDFPKHKCGWYDYDSEYGYWEDTKVIAWMPLPEPYKAN